MIMHLNTLEDAPCYACCDSDTEFDTHCGANEENRLFRFPQLRVIARACSLHAALRSAHQFETEILKTC